MGKGVKWRMSWVTPSGKLARGLLVELGRARVEGAVALEDGGHASLLSRGESSTFWGVEAPGCGPSSMAMGLQGNDKAAAPTGQPPGGHLDHFAAASARQRHRSHIPPEHRCRGSEGCAPGSDSDAELAIGRLTLGGCRWRSCQQATSIPRPTLEPLSGKRRRVLPEAL